MLKTTGNNLETYHGYFKLNQDYQTVLDHPRSQGLSTACVLRRPWERGWCLIWRTRILWLMWSGYISLPYPRQTPNIVHGSMLSEDQHLTSLPKGKVNIFLHSIFILALDWTTMPHFTLFLLLTKSTILYSMLYSSPPLTRTRLTRTPR
jgi:hypothetical protein